MRSMRIASCTVGALGFLLFSVNALAQTAPPAPYAPPPPPPVATPPAAGYPPPPPLPPVGEPVAEKKLGVGYKVGNGLGIIGADVIVAPIEHLAFDLQANYFADSQGTQGTASGFGFAPAVQGRLFGGQRSTPYMALGVGHLSLKLNNVTASGSFVFANVGYEWRWDSGLGILLGAGVSHLGTISATDGVTTITDKGGTLFNLEFGIRYMFL
jgi:hypothetical protein